MRIFMSIFMSAHCLRLSLVTRVRIPWDSITRESGLRTQFRSSEYLRI